VIKLDMTLTRDIHLDPVRRSLATCLVEFANQIGALLVAEGIEHPREVATWQELGADAAQGYLFARPSSDAPALRTDLVRLHPSLHSSLDLDAVAATHR
jgi:EAL domain-containing protein (putative c-di-GMP-specific phosphodiesterase class I)